MQLGKVFDEEKKLFLIETGACSIEKLLNDEINKVTGELAEKKAKLEELKKQNTEKGAKIREITKQILSTQLFLPRH